MVVMGDCLRDAFAHDSSSGWSVRLSQVMDHFEQLGDMTFPPPSCHHFQPALQSLHHFSHKSNPRSRNTACSYPHSRIQTQRCLSRTKHSTRSPSSIRRYVHTEVSWHLTAALRAWPPHRRSASNTLAHLSARPSDGFVFARRCSSARHLHTLSLFPPHIWPTARLHIVRCHAT